MLQTDKPYTLLDYIVILLVCAGFIIVGLVFRCVIIYNWFKERNIVKEKVINT